MMKLSYICFSLLFLLSLNSYGQNDQTAFNILDRFSDKALKASSIAMKFKLVSSDQMESTRDTLTGSVILSKDKYRLDMPDNIVWFNGETSWSYLPAEKEVTITRPDKKDNSFQNKPSSIFTIYKKEYKCRLIEEKSDSYLIDLYPEDIKSDMIRIRLLIDKSLLNLKSMEYKKKDGLVISLLVSEYILTQKPDQDSFIFHPEKYRDVEIIDMR